jgi:hypothetical protein
MRYDLALFALVGGGVCVVGMLVVLGLGVARVAVC